MPAWPWQSSVLPGKTSTPEPPHSPHTTVGASSPQAELQGGSSKSCSPFITCEGSAERCPDKPHVYPHLVKAQENLQPAAPAAHKPPSGPSATRILLQGSLGPSSSWCSPAHRDQIDSSALAGKAELGICTSPPHGHGPSCSRAGSRGAGSCGAGSRGAGSHGAARLGTALASILCRLRGCSVLMWK